MKATIGSLCLIVLCGFPYSISQPTSQHPVISETFSCTYHAEVVRNIELHEYILGNHSRDFQAKKSLAESSTTVKVFPITHNWELDRYDINMTYWRVWEGDYPTGPCEKYPPSKAFSPIWDWVKYANYNGTEQIEDHIVDIYVYKINSTEIKSIGVLQEDPNTPYIYREINGNDHSVVYFDHFEPSIQDIHVFDIPPICQLNGPRSQSHLKSFKLF